MIKRTGDLVSSALALLFAAPLLAFLALLIRWHYGPPTLFRQVRPGRHGRNFTIYKFRTMTAQSDSADELLADGERLTRLGRWLRSWSLDELPQLWNVFKGDMSLVGPRPLLGEYLDRYTPEQARRHTVRPGITGWAQVNGRNAVTWEERFALDVWYVDHRSLALDLKIMALTIRGVLKREGISGERSATMEKFMGRQQ